MSDASWFLFRQPEVRRTLGVMARRPGRLAVLVMVTIAAGVVEIAGIGLLLPLLDVGAGGGQEHGPAILRELLGVFSRWEGAERFFVVAGVFAVLAVLRGGLLYLSAVLAQLFRLAIDRELKRESMALSFTQPWLDVNRLGLSTLYSYVMSLTGTVAQMASLLAAGISASVFLCAYVTVCFLIAPTLTVVAVVLTLLIALSTRVFIVPAIGRAGERNMETAIAFTTTTLGTIMGSRLVRLFNVVPARLGVFNRSLNEKIRAERRYNALQELVSPLVQTQFMLIIAVLLAVGALVEGERIVERVSLLFIFLVVLSRISGPVGTLNTIRVTIAGLTAGSRTIFGYMDELANQSVPPPGTPFTRLRDGIRMRSVVFGYDLEDAHALAGVDMDIPVGSMVAIVGPSGAGKTTLVGLLTRLFEPTSGEISVDGAPLASYDRGQWRDRVGVVSQDTYIFESSVADNVCLGREASREEVIHAATSAEADGFIRDLPKGYDTPISGTRLSGGQQQRIGIARALLMNPDLLILDEATSQLDAETEHALQAVLDGARGQSTVIVIAHRLSTVVRADRIYVMDAGRVVESGTHRELMAADGLYRRMVSRQFIDASEPAASA